MTMADVEKKMERPTCPTCNGSRRIHVVAGATHPAEDRDCPTCVGWPVPGVVGVVALDGADWKVRALAAEAKLSALIERVKVLEGALEPFANVAKHLTSSAYGPAWGFNDAVIEHEDFRRALSALSNATGGEGYGLPSQPCGDKGPAALLPQTAEPSGAEEPRSAFEVGKPAPYYCKACQAVPQAGYCRMAGCPTAPAGLGSEPSAYRWVPAEEGAPYICPEGDLGQIIAMVMYASPDEVEQRKRLIAKAPDMLAELKWCLMGCGDRERIARLIAEAEGK